MKGERIAPPPFCHITMYGRQRTLQPSLSQVFETLQVFLPVNFTTSVAFFEQPNSMVMLFIVLNERSSSDHTNDGPEDKQDPGNQNEPFAE